MNLLTNEGEDEKQGEVTAADAASRHEAVMTPQPLITLTHFT